ncbi:hypothetical protein DXG01_015766, partial [Tephrocybe rancida]
MRHRACRMPYPAYESSSEEFPESDVDNDSNHSSSHDNRDVRVEDSSEASDIVILADTRQDSSGWDMEDHLEDQESRKKGKHRTVDDSPRKWMREFANAALIAVQRETNEYREKCRGLIRNIAQLKLRYNSLKTEYNTLKAELAANPDLDPRKKKDAQAEIEERWTRLGKMFGMLQEPFPTFFNDFRLMSKPQPSADWLNPTIRYKSSRPDARKKGFLASIYHHVGPDHHEDIVKPGFQTTFRGGAKQIQSTMISSVRYILSVILQLDPTYFEASYHCETVPELVALCKFGGALITNANAKVVSDRPPFLFPKEFCTKTQFVSGFSIYMFQSEILFLVLKALLFGKQSIQATGGGKPAPPSYGEQWGILNNDHLPFDAVPCIVILIHVVLSPDTRFSSTGNVTKHNWEATYDFYRVCYANLLACDTSRKALGKHCEDTVFGGPPPRHEDAIDTIADAEEAPLDFDAPAYVLSNDEGPIENFFQSPSNEDSLLHEPLPFQRARACVRAPAYSYRYGPRPPVIKKEDLPCKILPCPIPSRKMSSTKLGDDFLRIPKLDVSGTNWVIYKDRLMWSIDARGLLEHIDGTAEAPPDPISNRGPNIVLNEAETALDVQWKKDLKAWKQGKAIVKQQIAGTIPDSLFMKIRGHETAFGIWEALAGDFQNKS